MRTATKGKHLSIVKKLIEEENVDPNAEDSYGTRPVMIAAGQGDVDTLEFLLSLSDKVNKTRQEWQYPAALGLL